MERTLPLPWLRRLLCPEVNLGWKLEKEREAGKMGQREKELIPRGHHVDTLSPGKHCATYWISIISLNASTENKPLAPIY